LTTWWTKPLRPAVKIMKAYLELGIYWRPEDMREFEGIAEQIWAMSRGLA
jgi:hypothetical protein